MQIVLGTISNMGQAMDWLKTTFMYARVSAASNRRCCRAPWHVTQDRPRQACSGRATCLVRRIYGAAAARLHVWRASLPALQMKRSPQRYGLPANLSEAALDTHLRNQLIGTSVQALAEIGLVSLAVSATGTASPPRAAKQLMAAATRIMAMRAGGGNGEHCVPAQCALPIHVYNCMAVRVRVQVRVDGEQLVSLEPGRIMAHNYVRLQTMASITKVRGMRFAHLTSPHLT